MRPYTIACPLSFNSNFILYNLVYKIVSLLPRPTQTLKLKEHFSGSAPLKSGSETCAVQKQVKGIATTF